MKLIPALVLTLFFLLSNVTFAAAPDSIPAGAKVFIQPMDGFETFLLRALEKKNVPVTVVSDEALADFVILRSAVHQLCGFARVAYTPATDHEPAISMLNSKTNQVVFSYLLKTTSADSQQATACARQLRNQIQKSK